jgi:hypothetical protein
MKHLLVSFPSDAVSINSDMISTSNRPIRDFLVNVLEDPDSDAENLKLALTLLLRIGLALSHPEMLVSSAFYALKLKLDMSKECEGVCRRPEVYPFEDSADLADLKIDLKTNKVLAEKIDFGSNKTTS